MLATPPDPRTAAMAALPVFLTVREVCRLLRRGETFVRQGIKSGTIPARRMGRVWMVPREELQEAYRITDAAVLAAYHGRVPHDHPG